MQPSSRSWYEAATSRWTDWPIQRLLEHKGSHRVSVVIPARNEAATIASIVTGIRRELVDDTGLVDELVVIDSDSADDTARIAADAGAQVHAARQIRPELGGHPGKGEALWKSQFVTSGDILVFIDADLIGWGTHFVSGLLGPLLHDETTLLVKGFYDRLLEDGSGRSAPQGGRVTELVARPMLNLWWPGLSRVVQPLAGEWAIRRSTFSQLHVPVGYGVELATLLDVYTGQGLDAIAQVDLGARMHSHQSVHDLGLMAAELVALAGRRRGLSPAAGAGPLWQFERHPDAQQTASDADTAWRERAIPLVERPPAARPAPSSVAVDDTGSAIPELLVRGQRLTIDRPLIMGVVNTSPESFSDAGRFSSLDQQLANAAELIEAGAHILDIGGQSAITNQPELGAAEELDRVLPVVEWVHREYPDVLISVDTYKPLVVQATLAAGAAIINDVSGLAYTEVAELCAKHDSALVVMHTRAQPKVRRQDPELYPDVTTDVLALLRDRIDAAVDRGLSRQAIIVDPGPDFTKTPYQTVAVLRRINEVHALGRPVLLALSRKDFIGAILEKPPRGRDVGTIAAIAHLTGVPGTILRVHDVTATREAIRVIDVLVGRRDLDPYYVLPDKLRREPTV